jgi:hypothetical protein
MSSKPKSDENKTPKITVAGVTFGASEVVSAVLKIDGREVYIQKQEESERKIGFYK